jgi:thiol-disulfide isomerase/thioredoxin
MKQRIHLTLLCALLLALGACAAPTPTNSPRIAAGDWRAWLDSPGGELPFGLTLSQEPSGAWSAQILNEPETIAIPDVTVTGDALTIRIPHYDSTIEATIDEAGLLHGRWWKTAALGAISELPFHAEPNPGYRFMPLEEDATNAAALAKRWRVRFADDEDDAVGEFQLGADGRVEGTFLTTKGDYRFLTGSFEAGRLRLSVFDGAHAFLFDARLDESGALSGDFWSRDSWHESWTATADAEMALPDPTEQIGWRKSVPLNELRYPDLDGRLRALDDPAFTGKARIIEVFGSWCPNCNDATQYLVELDQRYGERGLSILGLAFEMSGEFERDAEQVRTYIEHHGIDYPILVAGTSDKDEASAAFPLIERVKSYPTTIIMNQEGEVIGVWSGFSGPATGVEFEKLQGRFEGWIEELLGDE